MKNFFPAIFLIFFFNASHAQELDSAWLDFWIGNWDLEWTNSDGSKGTGKNKIYRVLGDKVIQENFSQTNVEEGQAFIGKSWSVYNPIKKTWNQTWVDNAGAYLDFESGLENGAPVFQRSFVSQKGKKVMQRMVFTEIKEDSFNWSWENSLDEGKSWNTSWAIQYKRSKE